MLEEVEELNIAAAEAEEQLLEQEQLELPEAAEVLVLQTEDGSSRPGLVSAEVGEPVAGRPLRYSELRAESLKARQLPSISKKPRIVIPSVKYNPPRTSPHARAIESLANTLSSFSESPPSLLRASMSAPSLLTAKSPSSSRPGTGLPPPSRSGSSSPLKGLVDLKTLPPPLRSIIAAGVDQSQLNPSIPFSGFPNLTYLRGPPPHGPPA
eukprot:TRINITY_DN96559_c0_g1_i1.p1 TRINITY_DN96559_c0_g1~~TRINITY_DN96559_c0_g1_i1.p1  ORF type:complete len:228 (+),score=49.08 TRINITY_DN96559_c0_g1_i1:57-686(+)